MPYEDSTALLDEETHEAINIDRTKGDFTFPERHKFDAGRGLSAKTVDYISDVKNDPQWVRDFRHKALKVFFDKPMPTHWATKDLENINFDEIRYYLSDGEKPKRSWDDVPADVLETFERLGIPQQERAFLAGVEAQYDSEAAYSNIKDKAELEKYLLRDVDTWLTPEEAIQHGIADRVEQAAPGGDRARRRSGRRCRSRSGR